MEGELTATQSHILDVLQEWVTGPAMWTIEGMGAVGTVRETEKTPGLSKSQTDGAASLQVAKKP